jgi:hypothetical protein
MSNRSLILRHLEQAERHVSLAQQLVARQTALIAKMKAAGLSTEEATNLLSTFLTCQKNHEDELVRVLEELACLPDSLPRDNSRITGGRPHA